MDQLTDTDRAILELERAWFKFQGAKETAIMTRFGMTATRYYQCLNALIDRPEALAADPMLVKRLLRQREQRRTRRRVVAASFE